MAGLRRILLFLCLLHSAVPAAEIGDFWNARAVFDVVRSAVISSEVGYRVTKIHREMGQSFAQGDPLVEFDDFLPRANVVSAEASVKAASAALSAAQSMYERNNASQLELENARRDLVQAEIKLAVARREFAACRVAAPFAGRVAELYVNEHELVTRGTKLLRIVDDSRLVAKFLLPEDRFAEIRVGDAVPLRRPPRGEPISAVVSHIAAVFDPASRTFDVWAEVDNADGSLRAGMMAEPADEARGGRK